MTLGQTYSGCVLRVTNTEGGYGELTLPDFTVTQSVGGPGGVGGNDGSTLTTLWLNGDNLPSSGSISSWKDISGSNITFGVDGAYATPSVSTLNGFRVASYDGSERHLWVNSKNLNARTLFLVYKDTSTGSWVNPFGSSSGITHGNSDDTQIFNSTYTTPATLNGVSYFNGNTTSQSGLTHPRPDSYEIHNHNLQSNINGTNNWFLGEDSCNCGNRSINGGIAELMVFSGTLNLAERTIVNNYLNAKYNIGLVSSSIYTYGGAGAYKYEMAGIGQATDGSSHLDAKGSAVEIKSPAGLGNDKYIMWAHDNGAMAFQNSDVASPVVHRLTRKWRVRNSGLGSANVVFHLADIPGFLTMCFDPANIRLLIDSDGAFNSGAAVTSGVYDPYTQTITYTGVTLTNGYYMTFGIGGSSSTVYVTPRGTGSQNGSDWANACTLDSALDSPRIPGDIVKLAQGVYKPTSEITITAGIHIIGGYEGLSTAEVSQPDEYQSIVSGDTDSNDDVLGNLVMYHRDINGSNLARLFRITNVPDPVTLEGFYITGMSQGPPSVPSGNHASVVWQQASTVNYTTMRFYGNRSRELGGALLIYNGSVANISNSIFLGNAGELGGVLAAHVGSTVNVSDSQFINNEALLLNNRGSLNRAVGGAIDVNSGSSLVVTDSVFTGNAATRSGGLGGAISVTRNASTAESANDASVTITRTTFTDNSSNFGGAIYLDPGFNSITINQSTFLRNHGTNDLFAGNYTGSGGAIAGVGGSTSGKSIVNINDSEFESNSAVSLGGAMYFTGGSADKYLTLNLNSSTLLSNNAGWGGGILAREFSTGSNNQMNINNSTFTANDADNYGGAISGINGAKFNVKHSTLYANTAAVNGGGIDIHSGSATAVLSNSLLVDNIANNAINSGVGTPGTPFTSIGQARWWTVTKGNPAGIYYFNLQGVKFSTWVDANGYVLIASADGSTTEAAYETTDTVTLQSDSILMPSALAALGNINEVRMNVSSGADSGFVATTTNATIISEIKANSQLPNANELGSNVWGGVTNMDASCASGTPSAPLSQGIYHACGNSTNGMHWLPASGLEKASYPNANTNLNLWVRAAVAAEGVGNNIYNDVAITATAYDLIGYNSVSGWQNIGTANQAPGGNSFTATVTNVNKVINTSLADNGGLTRTFALSTNGGAGSPAFNQIPIANCLSTDQRGQARAVVGLFNDCDIGSYETLKTDSDEDGKVDALDNCPSLSNVDQADLDGDSIGDVCDPDKDGDGVLNVNDFFPTISLNGRADGDGDGIPDTCDAACVSAGMYADTDLDNDSVTNASDNCPNDANADQNDIDGDGIGDVCDPDLDGDSVNNADDNCPGVYNPLQTDSDGNGLGDDCNALFVKTVASGLADCSSWNNACAGGSGTELQAVVDKAFSEHATLIYMAAGVYRPSATVNLKRGLSLYGGFTGESETYYYEATPDQNLTIITADTGSDDTVDSNGITESYVHQSGANLARLFNADTLGTDSDSTVTFSGMTLTGAGSTSAIRSTSSRMRFDHVKFVGNKGATGGALFLDSNSKVVVNNSEFTSNQSANGGAVYITGSTSEVTFANANFTSNNSTATGGALSMASNARVSLRNSALFDNQSTGSGGAIFDNAGNELTIVGATVSGNRSISTSAGAGGGAARIEGAFTTVYIGTSDFLDNTSAREGGAIMVWSGSDIGSAKDVTIEDTRFKNNQCWWSYQCRG